jgi:hypothetical protein
MKVILDTPDRLVVQESPWPLGFALGGGAALAFGLVWVLPSGMPVLFALMVGLLLAGTGVSTLGFRTLTLDRRDHSATLEWRSLLRHHRERHALGAIRAAEIRTRTETTHGYANDEDGVRRETRSRSVDRPVLILSDGSEVVFAARASGAGPFVQRINTWLQSGA